MRHQDSRTLDQGPPPSLEKADLENGGATSLNAEAHAQAGDPNLITWSGPDDPENPRNWPNSMKWRNTWTVSLFVFISPVSSSMIAPAMQNLGSDLGMQTEIEIYLSMAIFILAYAIGPIFFGPASELYGRVRLLQISNIWYLAWNLGCGFANSKAQLFAFRFLAGIGGSAPLAIGGGAVGYEDSNMRIPVEFSPH
jgi:hypothetical protein